MFNAIILAGLNKIGPLEISANVENKALILINDRPMINYVINALQESKNINKIVIVGPEKMLSKGIDRKIDKILNSGDTILENIEKGLNCFHSGDSALILTSDIPLITANAIDEFLEICIDKNADVGYPIITKERIMEKYPETERTYIKMKEGIICGGNIVLLKPEVFFQNKSLINELFENRKAIQKYVKILGFKFIIKFLFKILTFKDIEKRISEIVGYNSIAVNVSFPEMMIDLDKISDLELIRKVIEKN
ncbi:MAG: nucleotidyltransferase family protein [Candidatus Caldatribacteriota bacterium]|nr:nucleotidyltransferase family protein [Candidatus Caldatribacteriota bacterium]